MVEGWAQGSQWGEIMRGNAAREDMKRNQNSSQFTFWLFRLQDLVFTLPRHQDTPFISTL